MNSFDRLESFAFIGVGLAVAWFAYLFAEHMTVTCQERRAKK